MAKPKVSQRGLNLQAMREAHDRWLLEHPVLQTRWFVDEVTPAYDDDDRYFSEKRRRVSGYCDNKEQAEAWILLHDPDNARNKFEIRSGNLREFVERRWGL